MSNTSVAASVSFEMYINHTIKSNNLYTASCKYTEAGSVSGVSHLYNASTSCILGSYIRSITAQWGTANAQNSIAVTEFVVKNNYVG